MHRKKVRETDKPFVERIRQLEERLFPGQFEDKSMMKSARYFWHFRPSHHVSTGLLTKEDIDLLKQPDKRLLSVGAHPAFLERLLPEFGVPPGNILLADKDPAIMQCSETMRAVTFDALGAWPEIGTFDRIIFPESLCIAISDRMRRQGVTNNHVSGDHRTDAAEAELLAAVLCQALRRLKPGGIIRANGPMSHPNVLRAAVAVLKKEGFAFTVESGRFFLSMENGAS